MTIFEQLEHRRQKLGISRSALAARSGLSLPTVNRILSRKNSAASFANVTAVAEALGMTLAATPTERTSEFRKRQATSKAKRLVRLVQGTSALEGQGLDQHELEKMIQQTSSELLKSQRKLWGE